MKLTIMPRIAGKKGEINQLRREGFIPAVLYSKGKAGRTLAVKNTEFQQHLRQVKSGHLPTTVFNFTDENNQEVRVLVKDIQYEVTTYKIIHLDFEQLIENTPLNVKVPIECVGMMECPGIKLGGALRQVIRHVRVRCLPQDLPTVFQLDVRDLGMRQSKRLADIEIPQNVKPLTKLTEVVVTIVKR